MICRESLMSDLPDKLIFNIFQIQKNKKIITNWLSLEENEAFLGNKDILESKLSNKLKLLVFQRYKIQYYFGWYPPKANVNQNRSGWWPIPIENSWIFKCTMDTEELKPSLQAWRSRRNFCSHHWSTVGLQIHINI